MTKTEKEVTKGYIINGFKHFTQLATEYFPNHASCSSARKSMREKIDENLSLKWDLLSFHCRTAAPTNRMTPDMNRPQKENRTIYF